MLALMDGPGFSDPRSGRVVFSYAHLSFGRRSSSSVMGAEARRSHRATRRGCASPLRVQSREADWFLAMSLGRRVLRGFVPKVCPARAHLGAFWITLDYDDQLRVVFGSKALRALARIVF
jgi:hypothetical protein